MKRKFVLCIGASKSGTTWLYHYLKNQSNFVNGLRKEYNALSQIFSSRHIQVEPRKIRVKSKLSERVSERQKTYLEMCHSVDAYCGYFDRITTEGGLTADISPNYLALSTTNLNEVSLQLMDRGFEVYVVLLLRDPIGRIISFSKMARRFRHLRDALGVTKSTPISDIAMQLVHDTQFTTDYRAAIESISGTHIDVNKFIYPYEHLVSPNGIAALCKRLNLEHLAGFEEKVFNSGSETSGQEPSFPHAHLSRILDEQYRYCEEYFKSENIELNWHHNR